ncbi:uncharacterized protein [Littorina saxatilis]|uniref:Uncharacterized protein n=1 Tax=Littorina saxatilis TaxID=31220 RepID=A0AAN9B4Y0_9CAEN
MYRLAALVVAAICVAQVTAQCDKYSGRVWFLLDESETARTASSSNLDVVPASLRYDILRSQIQQFAQGLTNSSRPVEVELGIVSYQGSARQTQRLTPPNTLQTLLNNQVTNGIIPDSILTQGGVASGGSWTYTGLQQANNIAFVPNYKNIIVVVSAQASFSANRSALAQAAANQLRVKQFDLYVVAVKDNANVQYLDEQELKLVAGNDPNQYNRIESYNQLAAHLNTEVRDKRLCSTVTTTTPLPTTTPRSTTTPDPDHPCARCTHHSGTYNVPHPETCSKFYQCSGLDPETGDYLFHVFDCGPGTLFNETDANCVWPKDFSCPAWGGQCTIGRVEQFPHLCCGKYWRCAAGLVDEMDCANGQVYQNGQCRTVSDNSCLQKSPCPVGTYTECPYRVVADNPCQFNNYDPVSQMNHTMNCPVTKGWNQDECACSDDVTSCPMEEGVDVINGNDAVDCKSHMHISFDDNSFRAINEETGQDSGKWIAQNGVQIKNDYAEFNGQEGIENDIVFIPYYANRVFPNKFAIRLQFRFHSNPSETEYVLIANDRCAECIATLRVTASRSNANQWTFTFWVRDVLGDEASISANININDNQGWSEVKVVVDDMQISGTVSTPSGLQNIQEQMTGPDSTITGKVQETDCGLSIGQGRIGGQTSTQTVALDGDINDFKFYECQDLTDLN